MAIFNDFTLAKFNILIYILKASYDNYKQYTRAEYYEMLDIGILYDEFVKTFFEKLE